MSCCAALAGSTASKRASRVNKEAARQQNSAVVMVGFWVGMILEVERHASLLEEERVCEGVEKQWDGVWCMSESAAHPLQVHFRGSLQEI